MTKVAIIEDQREIRDGICELVNSAERFRCVGAWASAEEALREIGQVLPEVVLVDIGLPGITGIEAIRTIHEKHPAIVLVVLTVFEDDRRIFEALCAGASGYLLKKTSAARLLESLRDAAAGGAPISPEVASRVIALFRQVRPEPNVEYALTPHELRLLNLLIAGHNYKTAAAELGVTFHTISFHMQRIYQKLHVHSKSEAVAKVLRKQII